MVRVEGTEMTIEQAEYLQETGKPFIDGFPVEDGKTILCEMKTWDEVKTDMV